MIVFTKSAQAHLLALALVSSLRSATARSACGLLRTFAAALRSSRFVPLLVRPVAGGRPWLLGLAQDRRSQAPAKEPFHGLPKITRQTPRLSRELHCAPYTTLAPAARTAETLVGVADRRTSDCQTPATQRQTVRLLKTANLQPKPQASLCLRSTALLHFRGGRLRQAFALY